MENDMKNTDVSNANADVYVDITDGKDSNTNENAATTVYSMNTSSTAVVQPLKLASVTSMSSDCPAVSQSSIVVSTDGNKFRRNCTQILQPIVKKPAVVSTTSIKPLILPAPEIGISSQNAKPIIPNVHGVTSSLPANFSTNCQQQPAVAMGITAIQPHQYSFSGNVNRYSMVPMPLQNNYSSHHHQSLSFNNTIGAAVQIMPVNNQLGNSRVSSFIMAPFIGHPGGMLLQPNMTIVPHSSNTLQTINVSTSTYSTDFTNNAGPPPIQLHPIAQNNNTINNNNNNSIIKNHHSTTTTTTTTIEVDLTTKPDMEITKSVTTTTVNILPSDDVTANNSSKSTDQLLLPPTLTPASAAVAIGPQPAVVIRPNVKQRDLIRSQIYRMKLENNNNDNNGGCCKIFEETTVQFGNNNIHDNDNDCGDVSSISTGNEIVNSMVDMDLVVPDKNIQQQHLQDNKDGDVHEEQKSHHNNVVVTTTAFPLPLNVNASSLVVDDDTDKIKVLSPPALPPSHTHRQPIPLDSSASFSRDRSLNDVVPYVHVKRKLPSPEILDDDERAAKISKFFNDHHRQHEKSVDKQSPGTLFEKIKSSVPDTNHHNHQKQQQQSVRKTAIVRPEQRKILVHYLDDLIVFESDEPFPTSNKMQVVRSALKAGNIKLNPRKSKFFSDQFLLANTDDEISPTPSAKTRSKSPIKLSPKRKSSESNFVPLSIDIPPTAVSSSSCDSLDSSQVRPLSTCSQPSPPPVYNVATTTDVSKRSSASDTKSVSKADNATTLSSVAVNITTTSADKSSSSHVITNSSKDQSSITTNTTSIKEPLLLKLSPSTPSLLKQQQHQDNKNITVPPPSENKTLTIDHRPVTEWSVSDVAEFVRLTPGCENYVSFFQNQEIDGEALLLLSKDNLIQGSLNMKIGPALKLCARLEKRKALDPQ